MRILSQPSYLWWASSEEKMSTYPHTLYSVLFPLALPSHVSPLWCAIAGPRGDTLPISQQSIYIGNAAKMLLQFHKEQSVYPHLWLNHIHCMRISTWSSSLSDSSHLWLWRALLVYRGIYIHQEPPQMGNAPSISPLCTPRLGKVPCGLCED